MAVLPLNKTVADIDQASSLIGQGKYYEATRPEIGAGGRMRFDVIDAVAVPQATASTTGNAPAQTTGSTTSAKPAK